jgi:hypothetical protein
MSRTWGHEITASDRLFLHDAMARYAREQDYIKAAIMRAATYGESFPDSYTAEQVAAGRELHYAGRAGRGTDEWVNAMRVVRDIMLKPMVRPVAS